MTTKVSSWMVKGYFFVYCFIFLPVGRIFLFFSKICDTMREKGGDGMRKILQNIMFVSTVMTVLVLGRCIATVFIDCECFILLLFFVLEF